MEKEKLITYEEELCGVISEYIYNRYGVEGTVQVNRHGRSHISLTFYAKKESINIKENLK